jgi:pimeloyl-ACP methyl ester carboxylesterase
MRGGRVEVRRTYVATGNGNLLHVRFAGDGPPLLLLDDVPSSSSRMEPIIRRLAARMRVYAVDAPGHGLSTPLPDEPSDLAPYSDALLAVADALGLGRFHVAGRGTGAALAVALAQAAPERVATVVGDGLPLLSPAARAERHQAFPAFVPRLDGGHLLAAWHFVRRSYLYDPWYARTAEARVALGVPPPNVLHDQVLDVLRAGERYAWLARAGLTHPWPTSSARAELAPNFLPVDRFARHVGAAVAAVVLPASPPSPPAPRPVAGCVGRGYLDTPHGQLHVRHCGTGSTPLVVVHPSPGSAAPLEPLVAAFGRDRMVIAPDTLGNGHSDRPTRETDIGFYADVLAAALRGAGINRVDVWGSHTGSLIGIELAIRHTSLVRRLGLDGVTLFSPAETADLLANYCRPSLEPDAHGLHLVRAWQMRLDMSLFWPWYRSTADAANRVDLPEATALHDAVVDLLTTGATWHLAYRAAFAYPTREQLPRLRTPTLLATGPADPLTVFSEEASQLSPEIRLARSAGTRGAAAAEETASVYASFYACP